MTRTAIRSLISGIEWTNRMNTGSGVESLIIGANGLVGRRLRDILTRDSVTYIGTYNKRREDDLLELDITDSRKLGELFGRYSPKVVFNCANLSGGVDFCERNPKEAADFHLNATKEMGARCKDIKAKFIFISTDYVFDGKNGPYKEDDPVNPLNLYGRLKLGAEEWIRSNLSDYLIVRTTNVYGWDPQTQTPNYIMGLYRALSQGKNFNAPSFLWGNPTYAADLAGAIVELYLKKANGIFHIVGSSFINRFEWAMKTCHILGLDSSLISEIKDPSPNMVPRPLKSWLANDKFKRSYQTRLHDVDSGLTIMKESMQNPKGS